MRNREIEDVEVIDTGEGMKEVLQREREQSN